MSGLDLRQLVELYLGLPAAPVLVAVPVKPEVLDRYVGVYELTKGFLITVKRDGGTLTAQATGQSAFSLTAVSDTEFHFQPAQLTLVFPVKDGPAPSLQLTQHGLPLTALRVLPGTPAAH